MKSGLLKWCYQNQRPHHELQAKRKPFVLYIQTDKGVLPTAHICSVYRNQSLLKTTRSYLLVTKVAWLTQMPSWESKHDFSSKSQINYFKRKVKFKELRKRRNLLKNICPSTLEEIPARGTRMSRRRWEPCFSTLQKKITLGNLHGTWTGQTVQNENQGCEGSVLAGHNQEKAFPNSFIISPGAGGALFKGTIMVLSKILPKMYV